MSGAGGFELDCAARVLARQSAKQSCSKEEPHGTCAALSMRQICHRGATGTLTKVTSVGTYVRTQRGIPLEIAELDNRGSKCGHLSVLAGAASRMVLSYIQLAT